MTMFPADRQARRALPPVYGSGRLLAAALRYARLGWRVLPLHTPARGDGPAGCTCVDAGCSDQGKHPRVTGGAHAATTDERLIRRWWGKWPDANVGIATGAASGLVVVDIDGSAGEDTLAALEAEHGRLPDTRQQVTAAGLHLLFTHPDGRVPNSCGRLGSGLDIRGDGGLIVAAPSRHQRGMTYRWTTGSAHRRLAPLPGWLAALICDQPATHHPPPADCGADHDRDKVGPGYAHAALAAETARVATAPRGQRNNTLNTTAIALGTLVGAGLLEEQTVRAALATAAAAAGLGRREAAATIASGLRYGIARPRKIAA